MFSPSSAGTKNKKHLFRETCFDEQALLVSRNMFLFSAYRVRYLFRCERNIDVAIANHRPQIEHMEQPYDTKIFFITAAGGAVPCFDNVFASRLRVALSKHETSAKRFCFLFFVFCLSFALGLSK